MNINRLQELITISKLGKMQIAERCGVSRTTLDNVLAGADAKISTIEALARVLAVPVGYFFDDENKRIQAISKGANSIAAIQSEVVVGENTALQERVKSLQCLVDEKNRRIADKDKQLKDKEALLKEKERTIQILMERK